MAQTKEKSFLFDGTPVTYERYRYLMTQRNQATLNQVTALLEDEASRILPIARNYSQQELGGFLRNVVPGLVDKYGNVNAVAAMKYYDDMTLAWAQNRAGQPKFQSRGNQRRLAQREAAAKLRGQLYVAKMAPQNLPEKVEPIIGFGMQRFMEAGFDESASAVQNAMTRAVASYNRDVMLYNSALDDAVIRVQRVAEPTACAFCAMMAFSSERSAVGKPLDVRTTSYAVDFHNNCHCTIETIYEGDDPIRPDYYDQFEQDYYDAGRDENGYKNTTAKEILATMRQNTGRK